MNILKTFGSRRQSRSLSHTHTKALKKNKIKSGEKKKDRKKQDSFGTIKFDLVVKKKKRTISVTKNPKANMICHKWNEWSFSPYNHKTGGNRVRMTPGSLSSCLATTTSLQNLLSFLSYFLSKTFINIYIHFYVLSSSPTSTTTPPPPTTTPVVVVVVATIHLWLLQLPILRYFVFI